MGTMGEAGSATYYSGAYGDDWSGLTLPARKNGTVIVVNNTDDDLLPNRIYFRSGDTWETSVT